MQIRSRRLDYLAERSLDPGAERNLRIEKISQTFRWLRGLDSAAHPHQAFPPSSSICSSFECAMTDRFSRTNRSATMLRDSESPSFQIVRVCQPTDWRNLSSNVWKRSCCELTGGLGGVVVPSHKKRRVMKESLN